MGRLQSPRVTSLSELLTSKQLRTFAKMRRRLVSGDFALTELLHHLSMFNALGGLELKPVLLKEIDGDIRRRALVAIHKGMVKGNRLGIAGGELERIRFSIGALVPWPCKG